MHTRILLKVLATGIIAAASVYGQSTEPNIIQAVTAPVGNSAASCPSLPNNQSAYLTTDAAVYFSFHYTGGGAGDTYKISWQSPNGAVYLTDGFTQTKTGGEYCFSTGIGISGQPAASLPGAWTVTLLWNSTQEAVLSFSISAPTSCTLSNFTGFGFSSNPDGVSTQFAVVPGGGSGVLNLNFSAAGCTWGVSSPVPWITFQGPTSGLASGNSAAINFSVAPNTANTGQSTTLPLTINGAVTSGPSVVENSTACVASVTPPTANVSAAGGSGSFTLGLGTSSCWYSFTAGPSWLTVAQQGSSNTGYTFQYTAAANKDSSSRVGVMAFTQPSAATFTLSQASANGIMQTITFGPLNNVPLGSAPFTLTATSDSTLQVMFASNTPAVCTVSGNTVTIVALGTCSITASQPGNTLYAAATPVTQTFTVTPPPLQIPGGGGSSMVTLPPGTAATPYSQTLQAVNGKPPYTWSVIGGALPKGLSLSSAGTLSGTPAAAGGAIFTAQVTDTAGASATSAFFVNIAPQGLTITTVSPLPNGIVGSDYPAQIFSASGGSGPGTYTFQITNALPGGFIFSSGQLTGNPTTPGPFTLMVTVTDTSSPPLTATAQLQLTVQPAHADLILSQASVAFSLSVGASGLPFGANISVRSSAPSQTTLLYSVGVTPPAPWLDVTGGGSTPGIIGVNLDPTALSKQAGLLQTSIVVTCQSSTCAGDTPQTIGVSLNVLAPPAQLSVTSSLLSFSSQTSNEQALSQPLGVQNTGGGSITVNSITAKDSFVTITGVPATIPAGPAVQVTVTVNPAGLAAGFYQSTVYVNTSAGLVNVPVTLLLAQSPTMTLSPGGIQFQTVAGSAPGNSNGSFLVSVSGSATVSWNATILPPAAGGNNSWLTLNTSSGSSTSANPGAVTFLVNGNAANLTAQAYYASIQVTSSGVVDSPQTFLVVLNVAPAASPVKPDPEPPGLLFLVGSVGALPPQTVQVYAGSTAPVNYTASSDSPWLLVSPAAGTASSAFPGSSSVSVNLKGLAPGVYRGGVSYAFSSAAVRTVNVTLIIEAGVPVSSDRPKATCVPTQLVPTQTGLVNNFAQPTSWPTPLAVLLVNDCGQPISSGQIVATFNNGDPPLALSATNTTSGIYSGTWTPRNAAGQVTIAARATAAGLPPATALITGQVTPNAAPLLTQNGTLNVFAPVVGAPVAPGTIVQIYGTNLSAQAMPASTIPLPTTLNQTSVVIGGMQAPLYYVSPGQINALVPFELAPGKTYQIFVNANNALSTANPIQLTPDAPGIAQFYTGGIIAQHLADYSLVTEASPAKPGEYIVFYVAGMGLTNQNVPSGTASPSTNLAVPLDTPTLTLNGAPVTNVLFAGLTPTLVGLYQVDIQVPASAPNGDLTLVLTQTSGQANSAILPVHN